MKYSEEPLTGSENAEVREWLAVRRWRKQFWSVLGTIHDKLKLITGLAPWLIGLWLAFGEGLGKWLGK